MTHPDFRNEGHTGGQAVKLLSQLRPVNVTLVDLYTLTVNALTVNNVQVGS